MTQAGSEAFTVRPPTLDDAQDIANLLNTCAVERTGLATTSARAVRGSMQTPSLNLEEDGLLAFGPEGQLAGFALCHPEMSEDPEMAWVYVVGVRPPWRRRGIAFALLRHSFGVLYQWGRRKVSLDVDAQNLTGATRLYEKAGMHVERQKDTYEKELRPHA